ncbi:hypothetical protein JRO89_XS03G0186700 [Xanthoceras sorbifolium]|uniref:RRM domain-containing protein n=1 Tax=Xanthoceras sorbifolium TaxID=99658 RepID=A0ABQ8IAH9_9ROSI|nr:hypothetical protein JRO89_XS03G0186700 [Xanthoceras sorbifolium]
MARYRSRSRSYSPRRRSTRSPGPRGRKRYYDEPRRSYGDRRSPAPSGLLVRNLPLDARPEDLRVPFERYGPVKDVYLPKNYYTGEPRGFGFVKFRYGEDAAEAKQRLNHTLIGGREIKIVFAEENRKTPQEMRTSTRVSGRYGGSHRRTPPRSPRRRHHSYSRSPSPRRDSRYRFSFFDLKSFNCFFVSDGYSNILFIVPKINQPFGAKKERWVRRSKDDYRSPRRSRSISRSLSPRDERGYRSDQRSPSPRENGGSPHDERDYAPSRLRSPRGNSRSPSRSHS